MRFLFKIFVLPVLIIAFVPLTIALLIYKPVSIPVNEFGDATAIDVETLLMEELENLTLDASSESNIKLEINQKTLNGIILNLLRENNPNYLKENAPDDEKLFVMKEDMFAYQGSWVKFTKNNTIEIESGAHIFVGNFTFKTRLLITLKLEIIEDDIILTIKKLTVGNLPLAWIISSGGWIAEKVLGNSIEDMLADMLDGIGTFDPKTRQVKVNITSLLENMGDDDGGDDAVVQMLLQFVTENELVKIGFDENVFFVSAQVGKIYDGSQPFELKANEKIQSDEELETILLSKANSLVLSTLSKETPYIKLDELTLNRVLEYFLRGEETELAQIELLEGFEAIIKAPYISFGESAIINIPVILKKTELNDGFKTIIKIDAVPEIVGNDLHFNLKGLKAGELELSEENIDLILSLIEDNEIIKDGAIVLEDFDEMMQSSGINIKDVSIKNNHLYLYIQVNMFEDREALEGLAQAALSMPDIPEELQDKIQTVLDNIDEEDIDDLVNEMIGEMIETALETIVDNPDIPDDVQETITDILVNIDDPEALDDAISNAIDAISNMNDEEQEDFFSSFLGSLEDTGMSYDDLFDLLP